MQALKHHYERTMCGLMHFLTPKFKIYKKKNLKNNLEDSWNHIEKKFVKGYHHGDVMM